MENSNKKQEKSGIGVVATLVQILFILLVLASSIALAAYYLKTGPKPKPRNRQPQPHLVQVVRIPAGDHRIFIEAMGTAVAAKEVHLIPGVSGEIIEVHPNFAAGGTILQGETLITIDPIDYKLKVVELQNDLDIARLELELEMGNQRVAEKEFELMGETVNSSEKALILRQPQLKMKQAALKNVQARLAQAEINLARTSVDAPFNATLLSTAVHRGSRVSQATAIAQLAGTKEFRIKIALPRESLPWLVFPSTDQDTGSAVRIFLDSSAAAESDVRTGHLTTLAANIEEQGKLAIVYARVQDPLSLLPENRDKPPLLLGSLVRTEIEGILLEKVVAVDREHLREGNRIWVIDEADRLSIREVDIIAKERNRVFINNSISSGERLVISNLSTPIEGMLLQPANANRKTPEELKQPSVGTGNKVDKSHN